MKLSKKAIETLWAEFADCPINDMEETLESFCGWPVFTDREYIWRWFDEQYAEWGGVHALMFPEEHEKNGADLMERREAAYRRNGSAGAPTAHVYD